MSLREEMEKFQRNLATPDRIRETVTEFAKQVETLHPAVSCSVVPDPPYIRVYVSRREHQDTKPQWILCSFSPTAFRNRSIGDLEDNLIQTYKSCPVQNLLSALSVATPHS